MHQFLLPEVRVAAGVGLCCCHACVFTICIFLATCVIFLPLFQEQVRCLEALVLGYFIDTSLVTFAKDLIQFGFGNDCRKNLKVIHQFGQLWERYFMFRLRVKVENPLQWICYCLEHFHTLCDFLFIIVNC